MQSRGKILIIDDDAGIRDVLKQMLEKEGYYVETLADGRDAKQLHIVYQFDLIITDILMPEKEGIETILELRKEFPNLKIIAISGGGGSGLLRAESVLNIARTLGAARTLAKPFKRQEILDLIAEVLNG